MITSSQNPLIKLLQSLHSRHGREKAGLFLLEGVRLVETALDAGVSIRHAAYSSWLDGNQRGQACLQRLALAGCRPELIDDRLLCLVADTERPQGLAVAAEIPLVRPQDLQDVDRLVLVDGVQDPGNLGTIIRTADALGAQMVITLPGTVDCYNEKVVRSAMGSLFHLPVWSAESSAEVLSALRSAGLQLVVTSLQQSTPYRQAEYQQRVAIVVGNEGAGVSPELQEAADLRVKIPLFGQAESLNVAVATGIILAELVSGQSKCNIVRENATELRLVGEKVTRFRSGRVE